MEGLFRVTFSLAAFAVVAALTFSSFFIAAALPAPDASGLSGLEVQTESGTVRGALSADGAVRLFKGIPYAAPPVGELRWKGPQPVAKWEGIKKATQFGPRCMQAFLYHDMVFRDAGASEDCLYLNVWAPSAATPAKSKGKSGADTSGAAAARDTDSRGELHDAHGDVAVKRSGAAETASAAGKLPVMVWIYGGGFQGGSTSEPRQDGEHLAHQGVIIVSMNYRLGIFGFFSHPHLTAESAHHASGNYGMLDQVAALSWVHDNIAAFGGDPDNVTIFGESAGSFSVCALMASPLTRGLIHKGIGESGAFFSTTLSATNRAETEKRDAVFTEELHMKSIGDLRQVSAERLLAAARSKDELHFRPIIDGYFLPSAPAEIFARGEQAHIPLLAGWNRDEGSAKQFFGEEAVSKENYAAEVRREFGDSAADALKLFPGDTLEQVTSSAGLLSTAKWIALGTWSWIEAHLRTGGAPVYRYQFDEAPPRASEDFEADPNNPNWAPAAKVTPNSLAYHSAEIEFVFGTLKSKKGEPWRAEDFRVSELMGTYWTNFAKSGNPNGTGVANWPAYSGSDGFQVMHLKEKPAGAPDAHREQFAFLDKAWPKTATKPE
jgi:para-nitrobenzyl esterase